MTSFLLNDTTGDFSGATIHLVYNQLTRFESNIFQEMLIQMSTSVGYVNVDKSKASIKF